MRYFLDRGVAEAQLKHVGAVFGTGNAVADLQGQPPKSKVRSWPEAVYLPGWRKDGTINPRYGHALYFSPEGFGPSIRVRLCPPGSHHPNDAVWMPGAWGTYDSLKHGDTVVLCESYIKAMVVSLILGIPAIALNGVTGWSKGSSVLVDGLRDPIWHEKALRAVICFDSLNRINVRSQSDVIRAENVIAGMMRSEHSKGAQQLREVCLARLPDPTDPSLEDWGIDDFVSDKTHGPALARELIRLAPEHQVNQIAAAIAEYNARYIYIRQAGRIFDLRTAHVWYTKAGFLDNEAGANLLETGTNNRGRASTTVVNLGKAWFTSGDRSVGEQVRFKPGEPKVLPVTPPYEYPDLNLWNGPAVEPSTDPGAMERVEKYWLAVLREMFPEDWRYLVSVICSILQRPEQRLTLYVVLLGEKGTGKGYALYPLQHALGADSGHAPSMTVERYVNKFNKRKAAARVITIHELPRQFRDKNTGAEFETELKRDADANELYRPLEGKGVDEGYVERNATVFITTNYDPDWPIEYGERRCLALRTSDSLAQHDPISRPWGKKNSKFWEERWAWMTTNGPADVLAFALQYDLTGFDAGAPPPSTSELVRLMEKGEKGYKGFLMSLKRSADKVLTDFGLPIDARYFTSEQLLRLYKAFVNPKAEVDAGKVKAFGVDAAFVFGANPIEGSFTPRKLGKRITKAFWHLRGGEWAGSKSGLVSQYDLVEGWLSDPANFRLD
jgi:hypothetical protein